MTTNDAVGAGAVSSYDTLGAVLRDACLELMTEYGLSAILQTSRGPEPLAPNAASATVDFQGPDLRGTIGLTMTPSVVAKTYRAAIGESVLPDSPAGVDWTCELVNQLIGRVKNKLRSYQVSFNVSTPQLQPSLESSGGGLRNRFVCDDGSFAGYLDVMIAPGLTLVSSPPSTPLIEEGELLLF
ncbi:MAG: hypothetical protein RL685_5868 [Pseudomonadota bacterium]